MDFRNYDSTIGRFNVIDPLAEMEYSFTPYHFANDNPILYSDPSGLKSVAPEGTDSNVPNGGVLSMLMSGMSGRDIRDHLQEQMWGPNIILSSTGTGGGGGGIGGEAGYKVGGFGMRSIKPQGHFERIFIGNEDSAEITALQILMGGALVRPMYAKVWVLDEDQNGLSLDKLLAPSLYFGSSLSSLAEIKANNSIKELEEAGAFWKKISGKYPARINKALSASRFTKTLSASIGKRLFFVGVVSSTYSIINDPSASNIALNLLDTAVGIAAFVPGLQVAALIYTTVRIGYDIYKSENK